MKKTISISVLSLMIIIVMGSCSKTHSFKVMQFNIWQEGTSVPGGFDGIADQIVAANPEFVTLSEVRNYHNTRFCDRIVKALKDRGQKYYSFYSYDTGLLSKYPIIDSSTIYPPKDDHGSLYRALINMKGQKVALYTAHLDFLRDTYYDVRGYNGSTWKEEPPMTNVDSILADNIKSMRDDGIKAFISHANQDKANNIIVLLGGDFNEPSFKDWIEANKNMYDHNGTVVPWTVTKLLDDNGYIDAYRKVYPNPLTHPGFTYPAATPGKDPAKVTWAPKADERDRVDYIFYAPHKGLETTDACIWGPDKTISHSIPLKDTLQDVIKIGKGIWPTDHKAVVVTFSYKK